MKNNDLLSTRLAPIRSQCVQNAIATRGAIAAERVHKGNLNSGAYFKQVRDSTLKHYSDSLEAMAGVAAKRLSSAKAADLIQKHAQLLHDDLRQLVNRTIAGEGGARPLSEAGAVEIRNTFEARARDIEQTILENVRFSLDDDLKSEGGAANYWQRHHTWIVSIVGIVVAAVVAIIFSK